ncbi:MAG: hypothetical protein OXR62_06500 [Ahrensia sp.]|nr:hypothetical protein [Ahrensia sp.]
MRGRRAREIEAEAQRHLQPTGFLTLGWFRVEAGQSALMIGNVGSSLWSAFEASSQFADGQADPLDRWTREVLDALGATLDCAVRYPFGSPLYPFQRYAAEAAQMRPSPLGLYIHPKHGLWVGLRGALVFDETLTLPTPEILPHPCESCADKPCLSACPVSAFSGDGFEVSACRSHISNDVGAECFNHGCLARRACPVGADKAYGDAQQRFHMEAFR